MKRILFTLLTLALLWACDDNVCKISGTLTDPVDSVRLVDMSGKVLDVAAVKDGAYMLQCEINPETGVGVIRGEDYDPISLIPDTKKIKITMADGLPVISGSPMSQELQDLQQWARNIFFENTYKIMELAEAGDTLGAEALGVEITQQIAAHCREVYQNHKTDPIGIQALGLMMDFIDKDEFLALYEQGGKAVKEDASIGGYYEHLMSLPEEAVITLLDNGEILKEQGTFEDYVGIGKYTLVDFWASWCGPCRRETPNVVAVYEKYRDKGLVVIGVPVNDLQDATEKAMKDLGIYYPQVLDPSLRLAEQFNVVGIPYILLFDPDGNIVATDLREAEIEAAVKKAMKIK